MLESQLGTLEQVPLRTVWVGEANSFTPWLAEERNLLSLGEALGIDLELEGQEQEVGPFRADLLCKDTATDHWVLIENQLERTDHGHLGQLLTYAAGLRAVTIVWIAQRFTDEHRAALDWLNQITEEDFSFFGVEIELWKIGNSAMAPRFSIVSKPNDWSKAVRQGATATQVTPIKQLQLAFWTEFREYMSGRSKIVCQKPLPQHWTNYAIGRGGFHLGAVVSTYSTAPIASGGEIRTELVISHRDAKGYFAALETNRAEIERELGFPLVWHNPAETKLAKVYVRSVADIEDRTQWPNYFDWLQVRLDAFNRVFAPRVRNLVPIFAPKDITTTP